MAASSRRTSSGPVLRSLSPSGRFYNHHGPPSPYSSSTAFASSTSSFSAKSTTFFHHRSASPTRVSLHAPLSHSPSVKFSLDNNRSCSPNRSISASNQTVKRQSTTPKKTCMCSPTNHPGSFRCSLHKGLGHNSRGAATVSYSPNRLNARRSAMTNSLVRIGGVEGELVKRALAALIRPSSHHQRRRNDFQPRPSRLSIMSVAEDLD